MYDNILNERLIISFPANLKCSIHIIGEFAVVRQKKYEKLSNLINHAIDFFLCTTKSILSTSDENK